jgi:GNAT superfamily N-acetyltransferase
VTFRSLGETDIGAALGLWNGMPGLLLSAADEPPALSRFLARNPGLSWGAFEGDSLVATILTGHDGRRGFLYHLAVAAEFQGQGLSTELMRRALDGLSGVGIGRVNVFVLADNLRGLAFWASAARSGWTKRGDILVFSKDLN